MNIKLKNNKGSSLYFSMVVIAVILGVALGTSAILINQIRMVRGMGNSVVALYAADTGVEHALMNMRGEVPDTSSIPLTTIDTFSDGSTATYQVAIEEPGEDCEAENFCVKSTGTYAEVMRAIEVEF